jgi:hypothetical protein
MPAIIDMGDGYFGVANRDGVLIAVFSDLELAQAKASELARQALAA